MLDSLVVQLSNDPFNPELNLKVALEYDRLNQTASAVSFYLRAAEHDDGDIAYTSLLKMSQCFERQGDRQATVLNNAMQAATLLPERKEAYFRISQIYERRTNWQECYTWATIGLSVTGGNTRLPADVEFYGDYCLEFEKAISGWWIGRKEESQALLLALSKKDIAPEYAAAVNHNLVRIGLKEPADVINPLEPVVMNYRKYFGMDAPIIFDLGTRDGKDAEYLGQKLNSKTIYAIDANPTAIHKTTLKYPYMKVVYTAISDFDGEATFQQVNSGNENMDGCSSLYAEKVANEPQFEGKVSVIPTNVTRMDTFTKNENILGPIDIVKVDVEGYTWEVLNGFGESIKDVKLFHLETEKEGTHPNHKNSDEVAEFMRSKGFFLVDVSYEGSGGINGGIEDQVWVNPQWAITNRDCFS